MIWLPTLPPPPLSPQYTVKKTSALHKEFHLPKRKAQDQTVSLRKMNLFPSGWIVGPAPTGGFFNSKSLKGDAQEGVSLLTGEGGEGVGEEPNHMTARKPVPL